VLLAAKVIKQKRPPMLNHTGRCDLPSGTVYVN